jgi:hypothetical protein
VKPNDLKRGQRALREGQRHLTEARRLFEQEKKDFERERDEIVQALRSATARFGLTDWQPWQDLAKVVTSCLFEPLVERDARQKAELEQLRLTVDRLVDQQRTLINRPPSPPVLVPAGPRPIPPPPPPPAAVPEVAGHAPRVDLLPGGRTASYRPSCSCGWAGGSCPTEIAARLSAGHHVRNQARSA